MPNPHAAPFHIVSIPILPSDPSHPLEGFLGHMVGDVTMFEDLERLWMEASRSIFSIRILKFCIWVAMQKRQHALKVHAKVVSLRMQFSTYTESLRKVDEAHVAWNHVQGMLQWRLELLY